MKKLFIRLGILALIMLACDFAVGFVGARLVENAKGGDTKRKRYIACEVNADVLVFGSSRAFHHYDPGILGEELGMSVYNCGFDGNGIICAYGFYEMITWRYCPKVILYEVTSSFDTNIGDNNKYLWNLRYFYDSECIDSIFWNVEGTERYKMISRMYRFNSALPQLVMDNLHPLHDDNKGYRPMDREMKTEAKPIEIQEAHEFDRLKLYYLERLINDSKGKTKLIFTVSPCYKKTDDRELEPVRELCDKYGIPLLNHSTDTAFNRKRDFFYDGAHMNRRGATEYSKMISREIKAALAGETK
ncbi:MAG: hypothetical protein LUC44_06865 [Prevotellaceae bacterium]|nr:hypothetical protein [Prevotellaceae bacterium]